MIPIFSNGVVIINFLFFEKWGLTIKLQSSNHLTLASFSKVLARRGVQSRIASPATSINQGGQLGWAAAIELIRGSRLTVAGTLPETSPVLEASASFLSSTLTAFLPPSEVTVLSRRRFRAPAPVGFPSAQPIYQLWLWLAVKEFGKRMEPP
jgi:hypothetical protein